ncbi:uncharacterized protein (TIGR04540 family) [Clostridium moniliforme]|uniref:Uncharacterized protein (TIGR04540 family) n=1 Tax=Clostridium moniliforme TaxID=39489 RepID=A0ABS4F055_9CLOT|nr:TIGR04540 family protein [Clostridium moniliforme]MBP1889626.1 uncharacterized protein (TIGR04540 family) [Clostridium moniliforme]
MRVVYKNPKELATCLKDLVDQYLDNLMTYEKLKDKITKIVNANKNSVYKDGHMPAKLANILEDERIEIIDKIMADN